MPIKAKLVSPRVQRQRSTIALEPMAVNDLTLLEDVRKPDYLFLKGCDLR